MTQIPSPTANGNLRSGHIGLLQVVGQCFSIGPLMDVALFLGIVASMAGAVGPLAVLLAALGMLFFSMVVAFYASETGGAGAMGDYIERAWGRRAGVGALGIYVISLVISGAGGFTIAFGDLARRFSHHYFHLDFPWWWAAVALCYGAWWLNGRGAKWATSVQLMIISVSVIPFSLTAAAVIGRAGARNTWSVFSWNNPHGGDLFGALLFSILLFGGFETAAALAEETNNPRRNIPLALVGTVAAAAVLLVFCSYAGTIYFGPNHVAQSWGDALDGYAQMGGAVLGPWAALWIRLAVLVDFSATCIGFSLAAARGLFSLARDRHLPAIFARTNRWGVPQQAANAVFAAALLIIAAGLLVPTNEIYKTLFVVSTAQALLLVLVYMGLALGALRLLWRKRHSQPVWRWVVFPLAAVGPCLALYGTFFPFPGYPERYGLFGAFAALVVVGLWLGGLRMGRG
jgi:amino acid transporter